MRRRFRRSLIAFAAQANAELGDFCFSRLQRRCKRIPFGQHRGGDIQVPFYVIFQRLAFGLQCIGMAGQALQLVSPEIFFTGGCDRAGGQGFQEIGGLVQITGVIAIRHQVRESAQKADDFRNIRRLGREGRLSHGTCFLIRHLSARTDGRFTGPMTRGLAYIWFSRSAAAEIGHAAHDGG